MSQKRKRNFGNEENSDRYVNAEDSSDEITDNEDSDQVYAGEREGSPSSKDSVATDFKGETSQAASTQSNPKLTSWSSPRQSVKEVDKNTNNKIGQRPSAAFSRVDNPLVVSEIPAQTGATSESVWNSSNSGLCMTCNRSVDDPECSLYTVPLPNELEIALQPYLPSGNRERCPHMPPPYSHLQKIGHFIYGMTLLICFFPMLCAIYFFAIVRYVFLFNFLFFRFLRNYRNF